jgi:hypothetical protein
MTEDDRAVSEDLLERLNEPRLTCLQEACEELSGFSVQTRYPSYGELGKDEIRVALDSLRQIVEQVRELGYSIE